ncbi:MAG: hypothetical protein PHY09_05450 [Desulfuromonadaceae bacterium]|nr:hypothetical protein [Desulfuromonadaceae bacterium]MDD5106235.1 hypothetical protein [Desulfuromonadaceae bacterium]
MAIRKLSAGDIIEARCTKCREILNHRIVAMVEDKIMRVECNTCLGVHNYHAPPAAKEPKAAKVAAPRKPRATSTTPRVAKKDPVESEREEWALLQPTFDIEKAVSYNMAGTFRTKHLVLHTVFGLGLVKAVIVPNKMQVLFKDGIKLLRCG